MIVLTDQLSIRTVSRIQINLYLAPRYPSIPLYLRYDYQNSPPLHPRLQSPVKVNHNHNHKFSAF